MTQVQNETKHPEGSLVLTRIIDAPRELVFKAWTESERLAQWWGPACFTNPVCEVDARPGGALRIVMLDPDGNDYQMKGVFSLVVDAQKLVFTNIAHDAEGKHLLEGETTVLFEDENGKTKLTVDTHVVGLVDFAEQMLAGMEAGWTQSLVRLEEFLAKAQR